MHPKTKEVPSPSGNPPRFGQENTADKPDHKTDKPFCELLGEVIKKAYPNLR